MDFKLILVVFGALFGSGLIWKLVAVGREQGKHFQIIDNLASTVRVLQIEVKEMKEDYHKSEDRIKKTLESGMNRRVDDLLGSFKPQLVELTKNYYDLNEKIHKMEVAIIEKISDIKGVKNA